MRPEALAALTAALAAALLGLALAEAERAALIARAGRGPAPRAHRPRWRLPARALALPGALLAWPIGGAIAGTPGAIAASAGVLGAPILLRYRRAARSVREAEEQLADAVSVLASAMRSGRSLVQAVAVVAEEVGPPLGPTFRAAADRVALGEALGSAIERWAEEVGGADARLVAGVLHLHRRTGGALPAALDELAATLRARRSAARELRSLTAQARLSAVILGLLPVGFLLFLSAVARRDMEAAYRTPAGLGAIGLGLSLQAAAFVWIRRLLRVEP